LTVMRVAIAGGCCCCFARSTMVYSFC